jgi:hypothetical protein
MIQDNKTANAMPLEWHILHKLIYSRPSELTCTHVGPKLSSCLQFAAPSRSLTKCDITSSQTIQHMPRKGPNLSLHDAALAQQLHFNRIRWWVVMCHHHCALMAKDTGLNNKLYIVHVWSLVCMNASSICGLLWICFGVPNHAMPCFDSSAYTAAKGPQKGPWTATCSNMPYTFVHNHAQHHKRCVSPALLGVL